MERLSVNGPEGGTKTLIGPERHKKSRIKLLLDGMFSGLFRSTQSFNASGLFRASPSLRYQRSIMNHFHPTRRRVETVTVERGAEKLDIYTQIVCIPPVNHSVDDRRDQLDFALRKRRVAAREDVAKRGKKKVKLEEENSEIDPKCSEFIAAPRKLLIDLRSLIRSTPGD